MNQDTFKVLLSEQSTQINYEDAQLAVSRLQEYGYTVQDIMRLRSFGLEFIAINEKKEKVVIKMITCQNEKEKTSALEGVSLMKAISSPHVAKLIESFSISNSQNVFTVTQFYEGENVKQYIEKNLKNSTQIGEEQIAKLFLNIFKGVQAIHSNEIVHNHLNTENILISEDFLPVITDLDLSLIFKKERADIFKEERNLIFYPPENEIEKENSGSFSSDYFALGIILYSLCGYRDINQIQKIQSGSKINFYDKKYQQLLEVSFQMCNLNPHEKLDVNLAIKKLHKILQIKSFGPKIIITDEQDQQSQILIEEEKELNLLPTIEQFQYQHKNEKQDILSQNSRNDEKEIPITADSKSKCIHLPSPESATFIDILPNFSNEITKQVLNKLNDFVYDQETNEDHDSVDFSPCQFHDNQSVYVGQWKNGMRSGRGKQLWKDGNIYEGYWKSNVAQGKGRLIYSNGDIYEGDWKNDVAQGKGTYKHNDGARYIGEWVANKQEGSGIEQWTDGTRYEGQYVQGFKEGEGKLWFQDGSIYQGEFLKNDIHGVGTHLWFDGRRFSGEWKNNKMNGKGVYTWLDGRRYNGNYVDDKKEGYGEFSWSDGRCYKGQWINDLEHGIGTYINNLGEEKRGEWANGKLIKWITDQSSEEIKKTD